MLLAKMTYLMHICMAIFRRFCHFLSLSITSYLVQLIGFYEIQHKDGKHQMSSLMHIRPDVSS